MREKERDTKVGTVVEALPNALFRVEMPAQTSGGAGDINTQNDEVLCYLAGKMRMYRIKVLVGDKVEVILDPYGGKGRITRRL
ncbi:MAG: translation initiation factor IF-1 [Candidatus Paceibacterota bacterium]